MFEPALRWIAVLLVLVAVGCSLISPQPLPSIQADQFRLTIEADWSRAGTGSPVQIHHRLSNESSVAVCAGDEAILVDDQVVQATHILDGLCKIPLVVVLSGETGEWSTSWGGIACWPDAPPGVVELRPHLQCGAEVEVTSRIAIYRFEDNAPEWGATEIVSRPAIVTTGWSEQTR